MARMKNPEKPKRRTKLSPLREKVADLFKKANKIAKYIMRSGKSTVGFEEAEASLLPKDREAVEGGREMFTLGKTSYRELRREINRVSNFLASDSGTMKSAKYAQEQLEANERYYNAFRESNFHEGGNIDSRLDEDVAKIAFEIYRRVEETGADVIYGEGGYGSENLINFIYNSIVESGDYSSEWAISAAIKKSREVLKEKRSEMDFEGRSAFSTGNYDYGILKKVAEAKKFEDIDW